MHLTSSHWNVLSRAWVENTAISERSHDTVRLLEVSRSYIADRVASVPGRFFSNLTLGRK